jgi:hypothetical protein
MKRLFIASAILASIFLTGCGTSSEMLKHSEIMYDKQIAANQKVTPTPIFQLVARTGETIEMKGVSSISIYNPTADTGAGKVPEYKLPKEPVSEFFSTVVTEGRGLVRDFFGFKLGLAGKSQSTSAADTTLLRDINTSTSFENPFK